MVGWCIWSFTHWAAGVGTIGALRRQRDALLLERRTLIDGRDAAVRGRHPHVTHAP